MAEQDDPELLAEDLEAFPAKAPEGKVDLSDEQLEKQSAAKQAAAESLEDGDLQKALESFTEAITIGNASAMLYAKRADLLLKLKRPCACISDCNSAIETNPDSAKAHRIRGKAYRYLGKWEEAYKDLSLSQQLDFDDDLVEMHSFVKEKMEDASSQVRARNWTAADNVDASDEEEEQQHLDEEAGQHAAEEENPAGPNDDGELIAEDPEPYPEKGPILDDELTVMNARKQQDTNQRAIKAAQKGQYEKALETFTEAINMGNATAAMYVKRAEVLLKLRRPCACISDCSSALELNPDSARAHRARGKSYGRLGRWEDAHKDISLSQQIDFDEDLVDLQRIVAAEVSKIQQQRAEKRVREEQCFEESLMRRRKVHEERAQAQAEAAAIEAEAKAEQSLWRRCGRCSRRLRGKGPVDADSGPTDPDSGPSADTEDTSNKDLD